MLMFLLVGLLVCSWLVYKYWVSAYRHWEKRTLPFVPATFPYGSDFGTSFFTSFMAQRLDKMYKEMAPSPYFGIYILRSPFLVIRDPEIVKLVLAKEFSHFRDRNILSISDDDLLEQHLFTLDGERWRALRIKMTPTFSSGKLKNMFPLFVKCAEVLETMLSVKTGPAVEVKEIISSFTLSTITSIAFGLEVGEDNPLKKLAKDAFSLPIWLYLRLLAMTTFPNLGGYRVNKKEIEDYFIDLVRKTMETRRSKGIKRDDFLELMMELKEKGELLEDDTVKQDPLPGQQPQPFELTTDVIAAQCFVFLAAGYETSSSVQSFCLYELALNPEIQERLRSEVDSVLDKHGGKLSYEALNEMPYLDMVVHETMRKYPTIGVLSRRCTKAFSMPAGNKVQVGDKLLIPTWSFHHDPQLFPEPERFDPERFSEANKPSIKPYSYLPFGEGPRICIGARFGLLQTKVGIVTFLRKFEVSPSQKTQVPIKFAPTTLVTIPEVPIVLKIAERAS